MKYIVNTPSPTFDGTRAGISFRNGSTGEIELTEVKVKAFKHAGYEVIEVKEAKPEKKVETKKAETKKKRGE